MPEQVCIQCAQELTRAFLFKKRCEKSEATLRLCIGTLAPVDELNYGFKYETNITSKDNPTFISEQIKSFNNENGSNFGKIFIYKVNKENID